MFRNRTSVKEDGNRFQLVHKEEPSKKDEAAGEIVSSPAEEIFGQG